MEGSNYETKVGFVLFINQYIIWVWNYVNLFRSKLLEY